MSFTRLCCAVLALFTIGATDEILKWLKLPVARQQAMATGKAVVVYTGYSLKEPADRNVGKADGAFGDGKIKKRYGEFLYVRLFDKTEADAVKATERGQVIIFDPDWTELARGAIDGPDPLVKLMDEAKEKYSDKVPSWSEFGEGSLKTSAEEKKLVVIAFFADNKESDTTLKAMSDRVVAKFHEKCAFYRFAFQKDSEEAKKWGVSSAPTLLAIDPSKESGPKAVLERASGKKGPPELKSFLLKAFKALDKPSK